MKKQRKICLLLCSAMILATGDLYSDSASSHDISVSITPITNGLILADISHGNMIDPVAPTSEAWNQAFTDCRGQKAAPTDVIILIKNLTKRKLVFFEDWNSWGYENLKFVFWGCGHEYWVTKKAGFWTRNYPSTCILDPGQCLKVPVAFTNFVWNNMDQVAAKAKEITHVRALYEQHVLPADDLYKVWQGSVSSDYYPTAELLPRFNFSKLNKNEYDVKTEMNGL